MLPNNRRPVPPPAGAMPGGMPVPPTRQGAPVPPPAGGMPPAGRGGEEITPEQARSAILTVLTRVKAIAERFGLDLQELLASINQEGRVAEEETMPPEEV